MLNEILKLGARRGRLRVKIFGGGHVMRVHWEIGRRNVQFVQDYARREGLTMLAQDVRGRMPRDVIFFPRSAQAFVRRLPSTEVEPVRKEEKRYLRSISAPQEDEGAFELF
jgi:chemotaxis protein CheD